MLEKPVNWYVFLYLEGMVDVLVPTCTEIQIEC